MVENQRLNLYLRRQAQLDKTHAVLIDILSEFAICDLTEVPQFDKAKWGRKVFKIYKTLRQTESKLSQTVGTES